jgi:serine/threonine-protein kinase
LVARHARIAQGITSMAVSPNECYRCRTEEQDVADTMREFDRYIIERELGAGGMGRVYLAHDPKLNRRVALKVMLEERVAAGSDGPSLASRLVREARSAAAFQHPNAVTVFDVGEFEGRPFIAMEYVQGSSLRIRARDASSADKLRWLLQVARALGAAHKAGIIHRDIKPDNVIITIDDQAKVVDFGIARRPSLPAGAAEPTVDGGMETVTAAGQIVGTPLYMAPEQIQAGQVTDKTDQFSWGVMAY